MSDKENCTVFGEHKHDVMFTKCPVWTGFYANLKLCTNFMAKEMEFSFSHMFCAF